MKRNISKSILNKLGEGWLVILLGWGLCFRLAIAYFLPPGYDEAYYYLYTLHPAPSYFDHPPLVGLVTGFGIWLTGGLVSPFTIRLGTVFLYTATLFFFYRTSEHLFNKRTAILSLAIATSIPFFQIGFGILTLPDSPLMFFWTAALWLASCEFFPEGSIQFEIQEYQPSWRLVLLGLLVGCACLGKYHGVLLGIGILIFCLLSPKHRKVFSSTWLAVGILSAVIAIAPVLIWNYQHDWVSIRFQSARAVPQSGYRFGDLLVVFLVGVGYLFPSFGFPIWWISTKKTWALIRNKSLALRENSELQKNLFILSVSVPVFLGFTLMGGYRQILPSWHMPGFFGATLLLGNQMAIAQTSNPKLIRNWLFSSSMLVLIILMITLLHITSGIFQKDGERSILGGFWLVSQDPSTELVDVQQIRDYFQNSPQLTQELRNADFIFTNNYILSGQVGMAIASLTQPIKPITTFDPDLRGFAFWSKNSDWLDKNALYITSELFQNTEGKTLDYLEASGEKEIAQSLRSQLKEDRVPALKVYEKLFQSVTKLDEVPIQRGGATTQVFWIYRANRLLRPYPRPYGN
jgi:hypothetical protein